MPPATRTRLSSRISIGTRSISERPKTSYRRVLVAIFHASKSAGVLPVKAAERPSRFSRARSAGSSSQYVSMCTVRPLADSPAVSTASPSPPSGSQPSPPASTCSRAYPAAAITSSLFAHGTQSVVSPAGPCRIAPAYCAQLCAAGLFQSHQPSRLICRPSQQSISAVCAHSRQGRPR